MTLVSAVSFFDFTRQRFGYVLAVDKRVAETEGTLDQKEEIKDGKSLASLEGVKAFSGRNHIGLYSGVLGLERETPSASPIERFNFAMKSFDNVFDDIRQNKRYSGIFNKVIPVKDVRFLIAKRSSERVELYKVEQEENKDYWRAKQVNSCSFRASGQNSALWIGFIDEKLMQVPLNERVDMITAQKYIMSSMKIPEINNMLINNPDFNFFLVDNKEKGKIEQGSLFPF